MNPHEEKVGSSRVTNSVGSKNSDSEADQKYREKYPEVKDYLISKLEGINAKEGVILEKGDALPGTCEWIEKVGKYLIWEGPERSNFLWICGHPGKGKSHIAMHVKTRLEKKDAGRPIVLSYFFDAQNVLRSTEHAMVLSLLNRLLDCLASDDKGILHFCKIFLDRIPQRNNSDPFGGERLVDHRYLLKEMIGLVSLSRRVYLVLDGLDECNHNSLGVLVHWLEGLQNHAVKIVIVSRPLERLQQPDKTIDLNEKEFQNFTNEDIGKFILSKCDLKDEQKKEKFKNTLIKRAEGTFLWVALAMSEGLDDGPTQEKIARDEADLDRFPSGLNAMYSRILLEVLKHRQRNERCKSMVRILHHLALSQRPLSREELLCITDDPDIVDDTLQAFRNILSGTENPANEPITLIHMSLKDYLTRDLSSLLQRFFSTETCWKLSWLVRPGLYYMEMWLSERSQQLWLFECFLLLPTLMWIVCTIRVILAGFTISGILYIRAFERMSPILYLRKLLLSTITGILFDTIYGSWYICYERKSLILYQLKKFLNTIVVIIFGINEPEAHSDMFRRCVAFMMDEGNGFKKDMCGIGKLGPLESEERAKAQEKGHSFEYPCHFWTRHLAQSSQKQQDLDLAYAFLKKHFLHWLEGAGIFGFISEIVRDVEGMDGILQVIS